MSSHNSAALKVVPDSKEMDAVLFDAVFEKGADPIAVVSQDGVVWRTNEVFSRSLGEPSHLKEITPTQTNLPFRARPLSLELLKNYGTHEDVGIKTKNDVRVMDLSVREVSTENTLLVFRDVTEKRQLESQLISKHGELKKTLIELEKANAELKNMQQTLVQAGKMAALGELAAGIAHEINQPLQGIRGFAQELEHLVLPNFSDPDGTVQEYFKEIIQSADKMAKIIQHLRVFTRKSTEGFTEVDIHDAIAESLKLIKKQYDNRGIKVSERFEADLPKVYGNSVQLEQVFINLATNARDAIEATGRGSGNVWIRTKRDGDLVEIQFEDDGVGIPLEVQKKVFNPFFTTKEVGEGMGLGLSLSYGILNKVQGSMVLESKPGKGALFKVRLPIDFRKH